MKVDDYHRDLVERFIRETKGGFSIKYRGGCHSATYDRSSAGYSLDNGPVIRVVDFRDVRGACRDALLEVVFNDTHVCRGELSSLSRLEVGESIVRCAPPSLTKAVQKLRDSEP